MEQTQELFKELPPQCPAPGDDRRHEESSKCPFMGFDDLTDGIGLDNNVISAGMF